MNTGLRCTSVVRVIYFSSYGQTHMEETDAMDEGKSVDQLFRQLIDNGEAVEVCFAAAKHPVKASYVRYAVESSAPIDVIQVLVEHIDRDTRIEELNVAVEIAVDRGEDEEIALMRLATALVGE